MKKVMICQECKKEKSLDLFDNFHGASYCYHCEEDIEDARRQLQLEKTKKVIENAKHYPVH